MLRGRLAMERQAIFGRTIEGAIAALDERRRRFAKLYEPAIERKHRVRIVQLARDVDRLEVSARQPRFGAGGKSAVARVAPLHRRATAVASDGIAFAIAGNIRVAHSNFLAVVDEGRAAQCENHHGCDAGARLAVAIARVARDMAREVVIRERPGGPRAGAERFFSQLDRRAKAARVVPRQKKAEVERELQLVGPEKIGQPFLLARPGLADQYPIVVT